MERRHDRAALWGTLAFLTILRALAPLAPGMWAWALDGPRFLAPLAAWLPGCAAALALVPPLSRLSLRGLLRVGEPLAARPALAGAVGALAAGLLVWALPDRLFFVGDAVLRRGIVLLPEHADRVFHQAQRLDLLLHVALPSRLAAVLGVDAALSLIGAVEAALLMLLAMAFARTLRLSGGAALGAAAAVFFSGCLAGMTGYGKAFTGLSILTAGIGVLLVRDDADGRSLPGIAACTVVGLFLHRSAVAFLVPLGWAWFEWLRAHRQDGHMRLLGLVAAVLSAVAVGLLPGLFAVVRSYDAPSHFLLPEVRRAGLLHTMLGGPRLADLANLLLLVAPLAPVALVLLCTGGAGLLRQRETRGLLALALPMAALTLLVHPLQGLFRDWDVFFMPGVAFSLLAAWLIGRALQEQPRAAWLGLAVALAAAGPTIQWLALNSDCDRGLEHTRRIVLEAPPRTAQERVATWRFLGLRDSHRERWEAAADDFARAAEITPTPILLTGWALALQRLGDLRGARSLYDRSVRTDPGFTPAWMGLATCSVGLRDDAEVERATRALLTLAPNDSLTGRLVQYLGRRGRR